MDKRKDRKGRVLHTGESQLATGRYIYKYKDTNGDIKYIYSWRLTSADKTPAGKKEDIPLREKIKDIQKNLYNGIVSSGKDITVLSLVEKYIAQKKGVKHNTEANYQFVINIIKGEEFGRRYTRQVKISDAKEWLIKLQKDGRGYSTIHSVRGVVRPAFQMAVDDGLIVKNPFEFQLATVVVNDSVTREAVTRKQERAFLGFVKNDRHFSKYYEGIYILFNTGLRISEFTGLTISDIDFKDMKINVDHQLQRKRNMEYIIETTKTKNGTRFVPMTGDVAECLKKIIRNRKKPVHEPVIDGKTGFLYLDKNGMPMVSLHWEKYFQHICEKYNKIYKEELPKITPHVCRHTFCSNMAKSGMNPKVLQEIMGHSDISVTLDTYT
ncbi:MAG: site-specific integrase, partial [Lachnospiraceae bacterium]